jgi:Matrixin
MRLKHPCFWVACGAILCLVPRATHATTFVLMDERELTAASTAVVSGWVTGVESHADAWTDGVNTYVSIEPTAVIAGTLPEGEIVLRERGGQVRDRNEKIFGAPEYRIGEQVIAFLSQDADGSLHTTAMAMGKYTIDTSQAGPVTVARSLGEEALVLDRTTGRVYEHAAADVTELLQFEEHVRTAANRSRRPGHRVRRVQLSPPELGVTVPHTYQSPFTYLGNPSRWFEPDFGQPVLYRIDATGDARNGLAVSRSAVDSAFAAWTDVANSSLVLGDGGLLDAPLPFTGCNGGSRIVFNDPFNEISDPSGCGGILAIGGYCSSGETENVNGTTFQRITLGKVVFNNGWEQCGIWNACNLAEVATHEIGHSIGLGHSDDSTATMAAVAHFDGRCASLGADDVTAAQFIYPEASVPTPTATAAPQPTSTSTPVPPPTPTPTTASGLGNDACANAISIDAAPYSNTQITTAATSEPSDPSVGCGNGSRAKSVWYRFTAPSNGSLTATTFGANYDTILAAYVGSCGAFSPVPGGCNDDTSGRQSRISFQATAGTTYSFITTAYSNNGGSLVFQLTFQGVGNTATPTATLTPRPPTPTYTSGPPATPTATSAAPTATPTSRPPTPTFTTAPAPVPAGLTNDSVDAPVDILATPFTHTMSTTSATLDASDPSPTCGNRSRARSVWYRFIAPSDGMLTVDTFGSSYDTILTAFVASGGRLSAVTCNDDTSSMQSRVFFQTSSGTTYYVMVTAYGNNGGNLVVHANFQSSGAAPPRTATATTTQASASATPTATQPPAFTATPTMTPATSGPPNAGLANDMCPSATEISAAPYSASMVTQLAAAEPGYPAPACGNRSNGRSVWYRFTATASGTLSANTYGSNYDTILAAYTGSCTGLSQLSCNDDSSSLQSRVAFQAVAGTTYYFQVTAYRNDGGVLVFQLTN